MSTANVLPPTLDEMIFAISEINYSTICRPSSPSPQTDRLSGSTHDVLPPTTAPTVDCVTGIDVSNNDDDEEDSEDDGEDDDEDEENRLTKVVSGSLDSNRWPRTHKSKHLALLDLLALLIVTKAKSDVAATMLVTNGSMKFYYSKNRPLTNDENSYVCTLFDIACKTDRAPNDRSSDLLALVVDKCQRKIKARLSKVLWRTKELNSAPDRGIVSDGSVPAELVRKLKSALGIEPEQCLNACLIGWFDHLESVRDLESLGEATTFANLIGLAPYIHLVIDQMLLRRIRKLGEYKAATVNLVGEIDRLSPETRKTLIIQEVRIELAEIHIICTNKFHIIGSPAASGKNLD